MILRCFLNLMEGPMIHRNIAPGRTAQAVERPSFEYPLDDGHRFGARNRLVRTERAVQIPEHIPGRVHMSVDSRSPMNLSIPEIIR